MKKLVLLSLLMCLLEGWMFADIIPASVSCRTEGGANAGVNVADSSKLSVRNTINGNKSWIKFNLGDVAVANLTSAVLKVTFLEQESGPASFDVSVVNDSFKTNIDWTETGITWNNAPGNLITDLASLDAANTTLLQTVSIANPVAGQTVEIDVLAALQADTDGIVQFVLHNSSTLVQFCTHDYAANTEWRPLLDITLKDTGPIVGVPYVFTAIQSCRTEIAYPNTNRTDSSKLSVRADATAAKSWIKFNISGINPANLKSAILTIALQEPEGGAQSCDLSAIKDSCIDNSGWTDANLTWDNAPGNNTLSQTELDPAKTTFIKKFNLTDGTAGQKFEFSVLSIIQSDTDGIVQFALHNSSTLINFSTHDNAIIANRPILTLIEKPAGADNPDPYPGKTVTTSQTLLDWTNPDPNGTGSIICSVYFGTDPNRLKMDKITLAANASSALISTANFPRFTPLQQYKTYYWTVDCYDTSESKLIPGLMWDMNVNNNTEPLVNAGFDQVVWGLPNTVSLAGTTSDDGLPTPPTAYTVAWSQVSGPETVTFSPVNANLSSVTVNSAGVYVFKLTANDSEETASDNVRIVVGTDACQASHLSSNADYDAGDVNEDCIVNMDDFAELISVNWMNCTDEQTGCN